MIRRALVALLMPAVLAAQTPRAGQQPDTASGILYNPDVVQMRTPTTARDDDSLVQAIEHKIKCQCGCNLDVFTCRTTDFTCTTSPAMHRLVLARLDSNMTADQVIASFVSQYGLSALMEPPKKGFNLSAYIMPFVGLAFGLGLLGFAMRRLVQSHAATPDSGPRSPGADGASPEELAKLKEELDKFEA